MLFLLAVACVPHLVSLDASDAPAPDPSARQAHRLARLGSAADLDNAALAAQQVGDLREAVALAREAYVAAPDRRRHRYIRELETRLAASSGSAALP